MAFPIVVETTNKLVGRLLSALRGRPPLWVPFFWPWWNIGVGLVAVDDAKPAASPLEPIVPLSKHVMVAEMCFRSCMMAYFCVNCLHGEGYPAFGAAQTLEWSWMWPIILRWVLLLWAVCGIWDFYLLHGFGFESLKKKMHKYKMNPKYPDAKQFWRDFITGTLNAVMGALVEIFCCHGWCHGFFPKVEPRVFTIKNVLIIATMAHTKSVMFYLSHRVMHPWRIPGVPDIGKFLYQHIHRVHHLDHNPSAWSAISGHPLEALIVLVFAPVFAVSGAHPVVVLGSMVEFVILSAIGHDGFNWPGAGPTFHVLHHELFDCNYGNDWVPLDYWFGTFVSSKEDLKDKRQASSNDHTKDKQNAPSEDDRKVSSDIKKKHMKSVPVEL